MAAKKTQDQVQAWFRAPKHFVDLADKLAVKLSSPGLRRVTRSEVFRLAVFRGLEALEKENMKASKRRST